MWIEHGKQGDLLYCPECEETTTGSPRHPHSFALHRTPQKQQTEARKRVAGTHLHHCSMASRLRAYVVPVWIACVDAGPRGGEDEQRAGAAVRDRAQSRERESRVHVESSMRGRQREAGGGWVGDSRTCANTTRSTPRVLSRSLLSAPARSSSASSCGRARPAAWMADLQR